MVVSDSIETKKCSACNKNLAVINYHRKRNKLDSRCKACVSKNKKKKYLLKKQAKVEEFRDIIIKPYSDNRAIDRNDLILELGSFLMEEFRGEQRISC